MPITKNALVRYQTLDKCFSNPGRKYSIKDLLNACNESLWALDPNSSGVKKRQLYDDINFMESSQGWSIPLLRKKEGRNTYFEYEDRDYSINNQPINELEAEQLKSAMMVLTRFKGMPQFEWVNELLPKLDQSFRLSSIQEHIMSFEENPFLKGLEHIAPIFNAINNQQTLEITYQPYDKDEFKITFFPYHLKQFNSRWFLLGRNPDYKNLSNYPLDRIKTIKNMARPYQETSIDFEEYFEDLIGVTMPLESKLEEIVLRFSENRINYVLTKPIHGSQKIDKSDSSGLIIKIKVIPNPELYQLILSFGEDVSVLSPKSVVELAAKKIKLMNQNYNNVD